MANEGLPTNRGFIWVKGESTYGTDPTLVNSDLRYVENWEGQAKYVLTERTGQSPYRGGFRPVHTDTETTWSGDVEMATFDVPATDDGTRPEIDPWLLGGGWQDDGYTTDGAGAGKDTQEYTLLSFDLDPGSQSSSLTVEEYFFDEALADAIAWQYLGCRHDWTINIRPGERWIMNMQGQGATASQLAGGAPTSATYGFDQPAIGSKTSARLVELNGDSVYGGQIIEATIAGNMNVVRQMGMSGAIGAAEIRHNPQQGVRVEMLVEQVADSDWDPTTMQASADGTLTGWTLAINSVNGNNSISLASTVNGTTGVLTGFYVSLQEMEVIADQDGRRVWRFICMGRYPESGSDTGGLVAGNNMKLIYANGGGATLT